MPAVVPRVSLSAEAARAAVLQAEFNEKRWVWIPDDEEGYIAGWVLHEEDDTGEVMLAGGGESRTVPLYSLSKMNPPKFDRVDDIADLTFLNEASVVHNLRLRYGSGAIYTYSGLFLVAINPYTNLPLYSETVVQQYRNKRKDENPPHIFAITERAWVSMGENRENQSILITGESGAGKTENTKKVIQYLASIAAEIASGPDGSLLSVDRHPGIPKSPSFKRGHRATLSQAIIKSPALGLLERQILQANPILEAFGNAQTQRNNNSSRFGKFIRISFTREGNIAGANIDWYLLEKSRISYRSEAERCFHVFYQLLEGAGALRESLLLDGDVEDYVYLNKSRRHVDGINDSEEWKALKNALDVVGFTADEQFDLFRVVAAILHVGNIDITADRSEQARITASTQVEKACHLLGLPVPEFTKAFLCPRVLAGREWVTQARTKQQALDELSSLCKTLYEKSFGAMVDRTNKALDRPSQKSTFIGVLDIAGFEIFTVNSFEQLCINYTNEKLQQFFNHHMFVLEQEEYARESIDWSFQNFGLDLQPTIDLIECREPIGIMSLLDEECIMPRATDGTFTEKLHALWSGPISTSDSSSSSHPGMTKYTPTRFTQGFIIQHYAGSVEYDTEGWLEKNKDPLNDNLTRVLGASTQRYIANLFGGHEINDVTGLRKRGVKKGAFRTVGQRHKEQLSSLMTQLRATQPHFVRCIVPNKNKRPGRVDVPLVLDQLRCNGVLEGIRIARLGYPNRLPFAEFRQQYEILTPGILPRGYTDGRKACTRMVEALDLDSSSYAIGNSKIFFKAGFLAELEERRDAYLYDLFSRLQAAGRMYTARRQVKKILRRASAAATIQRNARVYGELRDWPWWQLYTKIRPLLAATRNEEELRKKDIELTLIRERAEREEKEKAALASLKMTLEQEKRKVEEELAAERELTLDKDRLLERSKQREAELEDEVTALQSNLQVVDAQLDRAMDAEKQSEQRYLILKAAFDEAAQHLVRLESAERDWKDQERTLEGEKSNREAESEAAYLRCEQLGKEAEELERSLKDKNEDLARLRQRMDASVRELEAKLAQEVKSKDVMAGKYVQLEEDSRHTREQLSDLSRTATDYEGIVQKKELDVARLNTELSSLQHQREDAFKHQSELQSRIETLASELQAQGADLEQSSQARQRLEKEVDELRGLLNAKASEETRRSEVEKSKEQELSDLRASLSAAQKDLAHSRQSATDAQAKLKVDLENLQREHDSMSSSYRELESRATTNAKTRSEAEGALQAVEKTKRGLESDLQSLRSKHLDLESRLADAMKHKETIERQLAAAQAKHQDFEDAVLQIEREKASWVRQIDSVRKQLETETSKRTEAERAAKSQSRETTQLKEQNAKLQADLKKSLDDIHQRDGEILQLRSRQDKTIVEHVHVLEEAKRVTDRQLAVSQQELRDINAYVKSLEKAKVRLIGDTEDLARQSERERLEIKAREKEAKAHEQALKKAQHDIMAERKARELAELRSQRAETEVNNMHTRLADTQQQLATVERSKAQLESELTELATDATTPPSPDSTRRQLEAKVAQLESEVNQVKLASPIIDRIRRRVEQQQVQLRRLIATQMPKDDSFKRRLLQEIDEASRQLQQDFGTGAPIPPSSLTETRPLNNTTPTKRSSIVNGVARPRMGSVDALPSNDSQINGLRRQVETLELQLASSDRVRQHIQSMLNDLAADLDSTDTSKQVLQAKKARLAKENRILNELLNAEQDSRRLLESGQLDSIKALWAKYQNTITEEKSKYAKLEDTRKALLAQQRSAQVELEDYKRQISELLQAKATLQSTIADNKERLEREIMARNEANSSKLQLQSRLKEMESSAQASSSIDFKEAAGLYKAKSDAYLSRLEAAEIAKAKATRNEANTRKTLQETELALKEARADQKALQEQLRLAEGRARDLESEVDSGTRDASETEKLRRRLVEQLDDQKEQHRKDLAEREATIDQTRNKYQCELALLSEELQSQRETMSRLRDENRKTRSELDQLQLQYDDEIYSSETWNKEKERLESKIADLTSAFDTATNVQSEQQSQIVNLLSQVRELRSVLDEAEADRTALQKARRNLESRLNDIAQGPAQSDKLSSDRILQALHLEKQDLRSSLEAQRDRVMLATERLKKAEARATDCQNQLDKMRHENAQLDRRNADFDKQVKELKLRVVDQETRAYAASPKSSPQVKRLEARVEELTNRLNQELHEKAESGRAFRNADKSARDVQFQLSENERARTRLEADMKSYEVKFAKLRGSLDQLQTSESELQLGKRRAELDASEQRQKALGLEREVERLRLRLERPLLERSSPSSSPRK